MTHSQPQVKFFIPNSKSQEIDIFPATLETLSQYKPVRKRYIAIPEIIANWLAKNTTTNATQGSLHFSQVSTEDEWEKVKALRLRVYADKAPYMLDHINSDGSDEYDNHSVVFAAWWHGMAVGTIRFTPYPFESSKFMSAAELNAFLGQQKQHDYLEWSRLLIEKNCAIKRLSTALIVYAGLSAIFKTGYRQYFGYSKSKVRNTFSTFSLDKNIREFSIPSRGEDNYLMLKGDFLQDFKLFIKKMFV